MEKYEQDRIGTGIFATGAGELLDFVSERHAGKSIGRPPALKDNLDLGDPIEKPYEPKGGAYNLETGEFIPFLKGHKPRHSFNNTDGQYVDPKKK